MSKSKSNRKAPESQPRQITLWEPQFDERIRRVEIDGTIYFSVIDVFRYYGNRSNPSQAWADAQRKLIVQDALPEHWQSITPLSGETHHYPLLREVLLHHFSDARGVMKRATPIGTFRFFLRLAQSAEIAEWEDIRQWMAETAHERIEELTDPALGLSRAQERARRIWQQQGHDQKWIEDRTGGIQTRNEFTATLKRTVIDLTAQFFGQATDTLYKGALGQTSAEMRKTLDLPRQANIRDSISQLALQYTRIAEHVASERLGDAEYVSRQQALDIIGEVSALIGEQAKQAADMLGIDLVSGHKLLS